MIHRIYSPDLDSFKELKFRQGLNIILAEKSYGASNKQTRNRAGKSSLIELIHFLLGGDANVYKKKPNKTSIFRYPVLEPIRFGMEFDLAGERVGIERKGKPRSKLYVHGDFDEWPTKPKHKDNHYIIANSGWRSVLGALMFGLEEFEGAWSPSQRSMMSYLARRQNSGGFQDPMKQNTQQATADQQVNISYLLGLN